jgi:NTP pyrophosphohydrolases including oxidative damage repair enzymes
MPKSRKKQDLDSLPYRPCVGVMVLNGDGLVFTGRRIPKPGSEFAGTPHLWQMPQGGIDDGEEPFQAALRELYEETGITSVSRLAEAPNWIKYDLPEHLLGVAWKGKYRGQTQKWFAVRFTGDESEIRVNPPPGGHHPEFDQWTWRPMDELPELIVPFKRQTYVEVVAAFRHLAGSGSQQ